MSVQKSLANESFRAKGADVRPLPRMISFVDDESRSLGKGFVTDVAQIRSLAGVSSAVKNQIAFFGKTFSANVADVGLFSRVNSSVKLQMFLTRQTFAANVAEVYVSSRVTFHVISVGSPVGERFRTYFAFQTLVNVLLSVGMPFVSRQVPGVRKRFAAQVALKRFISCMKVYVFDKPGLDKESFIANGTIVRKLLSVPLAVSVHRRPVSGRVFAIIAFQMSFRILMAFLMRMKLVFCFI